MIAPDQLISDLLCVADGEVVGRIRLQKIIYLLEQKGLRSQIAFQYYHYGPYSRTVDAAIERGKAFAGIKEEIRYRHSDGAPFSVFHVENHSIPGKFGDICTRDLKNMMYLMKSCTSTVIELAATIHWLVFYEKIDDWRKELIRRKGAKTESGRIEQAEELLKALELSLVIK